MYKEAMKLFINKFNYIYFSYQEALKLDSNDDDSKNLKEI